MAWEKYCRPESTLPRFSRKERVYADLGKLESDALKVNGVRKHAREPVPVCAGRCISLSVVLR